MNRQDLFLNEMTLCPDCLEDYITTGYYVKRDFSVENKAKCDKCGRMGWTYIIGGNYDDERRAKKTSGR